MSPLPRTSNEKKLPNEDNSSNEELSHPQFHVQHEYNASTDESTTNSDEDNNNNTQYENVNGYCLLPQESNVNHQEEQYESENEDDEFIRFAKLRVQSSTNEDKANQSVNSPPTIDSVWSSNMENDSFPVDDDKANYIKNLMSKIKLPEASVPVWAQYGSEQDWQEKLRERITCRQTTFFANDKK